MDFCHILDCTFVSYYSAFREFNNLTEQSQLLSLHRSLITAISSFCRCIMFSNFLDKWSTTHLRLSRTVSECKRRATRHRHANMNDLAGKVVRSEKADNRGYTVIISRKESGIVNISIKNDFVKLRKEV